MDVSVIIDYWLYNNFSEAVHTKTTDKHKV